MFPHSIPIRINFPRSFFLRSSRPAWKGKNNASKLPHPLHDINTIIRFSFNLYSASSTAISVSSTDAFIKLRLQVHEIMIPEKARREEWRWWELCGSSSAVWWTTPKCKKKFIKKLKTFSNDKVQLFSLPIQSSVLSYSTCAFAVTI